MSQTGAEEQIVFNTSKGEEGNPGKNFKKLIKTLKAGFKCSMNKDEFKPSKLKNARVLIFAAPTLAFTAEDRTILMNYVKEGGNLFLMANEGGDKQSKSNLNFVLKDTGISVSSTSVIRVSYYKYLHPKEVYVSNGVVHSDFVRSINSEEKKPTMTHSVEDTHDDSENEDFNLTGFKFVYPFGTSLTVKAPAVTLLSSGSVSYPVNEAVLAYEKIGQGMLIVLGSWKLLSDDYFDKEENAKLMSFILNLVGKENTFVPDSQMINTEKFANRRICPNIEAMSEKLKCAIQDAPDLSHKFLTLFEHNFFKANFDLLPETIRLYSLLSVKHETLGLITPVFESPMLGLSPAVFPPILIEPEEPALELYDLDDEFANPESKLAQLTNKATNSDLDIFITENANILGLKERVNTNNPKEVLLHILNSIIKCKMSNI